MPKKKAKASSQDEAWPMLAWLFVKFEQRVLNTILSDEANPAHPTADQQFELAEAFLATARPYKEALESWLGVAGSKRVSTYVNDMIMYMTTGIHLAEEWRRVVDASEARRQADKQIQDSFLRQFILAVIESWEKEIIKRRREVSSQQLQWLREKLHFYNRGVKLFLRRQSITSDLLKRGVIKSMPSDEKLARMKNPPKI